MNANDDVPICTMELHLDLPLFHNVTKEIFQTDIYPKVKWVQFGFWSTLKRS